MNNLLIIEDNECLRNEIGEILKFEGFNVLEAATGIQGLKQATALKPDLILCDILMPGISGYEVLIQLKQDPNTSLIPFIFITAMNGNQNFRKGMELGADDYLIKPFSRIDLLKTINNRNLKNRAIQNKINNLRDRVIFSIPHEMKTPLSVILGFGEILHNTASDLLPEEISEIGDSIVKSGNRLNEIVDKYLIFIDLLTIENPATKTILIFPEYIRDIVKKTAEKYQRVNDFIVQTEKFSLHIKEEWIHFVLKELVDNAFKFSNPGQKVTVKSKKDNGEVTLLITDNGIGFSKESFNKIDAFEQFDRKIHEQQGIGLGLFLVKKIIEKNNGTITVESESKKGSTICIKLPYV